jgi:hypothetical protein
MRLRNWLLAIAAATLIPSVNANASTITSTIDFIAHGFPDQGVGPKPANSVSGSFTFTYDPQQSYVNATGPSIQVNGLNIAFDSPVGFNYTPGGAMTIGAGLNDVGSVQAGHNDFLLTLTNLTAASYDLAAFSYSQVSPLAVFTANHVAAVVSSSVAATPIPAPLPLFAAALGAFGLWGYRRQRRQQLSRLAA